MNLKSLSATEKIAYAFLLILFGIGIYISNTNLELFDTVYSKEDGFVEYGTALFLFYSSVILFYRLFRLFKLKSITWKIGMIGIALVFLFGAGEEISWGQRLFNIESSEYFLENNAQLIFICFDFQTDFLFFGPHKIDPPAQTSTAIDMPP